jgi:hypothetical protein
MRFVASLCLLVAVAGSGVARAEASADRIAAYENESVGVRAIVPLSRGGTTADWAADHSWDAFQGGGHRPIDQEAFFRIVGREDLIRRFEHRTVVKKSLMAAGGVAMVAGALYSIATYLTADSRVTTAACPSPGCPASSQSTSANVTWGLFGIGAGLAAVMTGHYLDPSPISAAEADRLAREHDQQLKTEFGLSDFGAR